MKQKTNVETILNKIASEINSTYGYYEDVPVINRGPCGVFAQIFYKKWNELFASKVNICLVLTKMRDECHHIVIRLPSGKLYDGGVGVHSDNLYGNEFIIEDMFNYDEKLLEKWAYGINRTYPKYCPNFERKKVESIVNSKLKYLFDMVGTDLKIVYAPKIKLISASHEDYPLIQNMARFYVYDMSEYMGWEIPTDGLYECIDFKHYWTEPGTFSFLIKVDKELAGFVIINKQGNSAEIDFNMAQFFILRKFKNKGIGKQAAYQCFTQFPGKWEIMVMPGNIGAYQFWETIIAEYTNNNYKEQMCKITYLDNEERNLFRFNSKL